VLAARDGVVAAVDCAEVGRAAQLDLGAGRRVAEDDVDPCAGVVLAARVGAAVRRGDVLARVYASDGARLEAAAARVRAAIEVSAGEDAAAAGEGSSPACGGASGTRTSPRPPLVSHVVEGDGERLFGGAPGALVPWAECLGR
jgi:hypothetical protein